MSNFWQRLITGFFFIVVLLGAVLWNMYAFVALFFLVCVLGLREYAALFNNRLNKPDPNVTLIGGALLALMWSFAALGYGGSFLRHNWEYIILAVLAYPFLMEWAKGGKTNWSNILLSLGGILYINIGFMCFVALGFIKVCQDCLNVSPFHWEPVLGFLVLQWSSDTFAYLTGRAFGKTPLAPKISPKKTWEGSIGGGICTVGISIVLYYTMGYLRLVDWIGMAVVIHIFGTFGDLIESKLKRTLDVKDSGTILPGHGGILDRFDSLMFAAPFALIFLMVASMF